MPDDDHPHPWRKFAKVRLLASAMGLHGDNIPCGKVGFVVDTFDNGGVYEVDFDDPYDVVTVSADQIELIAS